MADIQHGPGEQNVFDVLSCLKPSFLCIMTTWKWQTKTKYSRRRQTSPPYRHPGELDHTTFSDARLLPPPSELDKTYLSSLIDSGPSFRYVKMRDQSTQRVALLSEEGRTTARGNVYAEFGEIWTCAFPAFSRYASGQTDRQTDRQKTYRHADRKNSQQMFNIGEFASGCLPRSN